MNIPSVRIDTSVKISLLFISVIHFLSYEMGKYYPKYPIFVFIFYTPYLLISLKVLLDKKGSIDNIFFVCIIFLYEFLYIISVKRDSANYILLLSDIYSSSIFFLYLFSLYKLLANVDDFLIAMRYLFTGFIITFFVVVLFPILKYTDIYSIGSAYNLGNKISIPFFQTTIDHPIITILMIIISYKTIQKYLKEKKYWVPINFINLFSYLLIFLVGIYLLFIINRRGPIFFFFISILIVLVFHIRLVRKFYFLIFPIILSIPLIWNTISNWFVLLVQNSFLENIILRTDRENITELTGRIYSWAIGYEMLSKISLKDILGYHEKIVISYDPIYDHFHNGFLQLYYERGILGFLLIAFIILSTLKSIVKIYNAHKLTTESETLVIIFFSILFLTVTESIFSGFIFAEKIFFICVFSINSYSNLLLKEKSLSAI